jgi:hypothetical protein
MRSPASVTALLVGKALLAGCALASFGGCIGPRAITSDPDLEIAAIHSARDGASTPAQDSISEVRLGHGLDINGKVPPSFGASRFAVGDPIHLSMRE